MNHHPDPTLSADLKQGVQGIEPYGVREIATEHTMLSTPIGDKSHRLIY